MRNYKLYLPVMFAAALAASGCTEKHDAGKVASAPQAVIKGVSLETVRSAAAAEVLEAVGTVRARTSAVVSARVPGSISVLRVREGDRVRKGQLLALLDAPESQATAAAATAVIEEARRSLDEALSRRKLADTTFERYQNLLREQAVSRQEFDVKQSEKDVAVQGVARAEARLRQAQEGSKASNAMADYLRITAPIAGIIASKQIDLGASVFPGQPLLTIEDDDNYQLELALPESQAVRVRPGTPLQVSLDAVGSTFAARIAEIVPTADPGSRTFVAKVDLSQKGVKSGMFGRGAISLSTMVNAITVPKKAVVERGPMAIVWTVDKDNIARMRIVKVGRQSGERVEILAGLADADRLIVNGVEKVTEGARVE
jgi:RND family efflux transporter MFP subunit